MSKPRRVAVIRLSGRTLQELLQLPEQAEVIRVEMARTTRGEAHVIVDGVGEFVEEGGLLPRPTSGTITREWLPDGRELAPKISWSFLK